MSPTPLALASASPRRLDLLRQIGVEPSHVLPTDIDEAVLPNETPPAYAVRVATAKANAALALLEDSRLAYVLAADTVVACGRRILHKTDDPALAEAYLRLLSGRRHRVLGAVCVVPPAGSSRTRLVTTAVRFKRLAEAEIRAYLEDGEWRGKAGAYAIQGRAARFIPWIGGSYPNVVGLPLTETVDLLEGLGWRPA